MPTPEVSSGGLAADEVEETWAHSTVALVSHIRCPIPAFSLRSLVPSVTLLWVVRMTELVHASNIRTRKTQRSFSMHHSWHSLSWASKKGLKQYWLQILFITPPATSPLPSRGQSFLLEARLTFSLTIFAQVWHWHLTEGNVCAALWSFKYCQTMLKCSKQQQQLVFSFSNLSMNMSVLWAISNSVFIQFWRLR